MDRGAWRATVHGIAKSGTRLSDFHSYFLLSFFIFMWTIFKVFIEFLQCCFCFMVFGGGVCPKVRLVKAIYGFSSGHGWM